MCLPFSTRCDIIYNELLYRNRGIDRDWLAGVISVNKYTFSTQSGKAYYCNSVPGFIKDNALSIIGQLVRHSFEVNKEQSNAWSSQIEQLQNRLRVAGMEGDIIFEYDIVRLGKRIDVILLIRHMVFSLEFKNGKKVFTAQDAQQAEDYATDIKNFHKESENLYVCPILIATEAPEYQKPQSLNCYPECRRTKDREGKPKDRPAGDNSGDTPGAKENRLD